MKSLFLLFSSFCLLFILSCEKDSHQYLELELKSAENIEINNPDFIVSVYGFDPNYTDVPASLITSQSYKSDKLPVTLKIVLPEDPEKKIKYSHGKEYARYYLAITWDSDGNGKICQGDITIDHSSNSFYIELKEDKQIVNLHQIPESTLCDLKTFCRS